MSNVVEIKNVEDLGGNESVTFELRDLKASDIGPMCKIISKIGVEEIREYLQSDEVSQIVTAARNEDGESKKALEKIGFSAALSVVNILVNNLPNCQNELFSFMAGLSGQTPEDVADMALGDFTSMLLALFQKGEFSNFMKAVSKFMK